MPKSRTPLIVMALFMLAIGVSIPLCLSTLLADGHPATPAPPTRAPTKASLSTISVLLIQVDSLSAPQPVLEVLTVIKYQTEVNSFFLMMVSPETSVGPVGGAAPPKALRSFYADDVRFQRQALITHAALREISPQLGDIFVDVNYDREALAGTFSQLGQFDCRGKPQTGEGLLRQLDALPPDAAEKRLHLQSQILYCLFEGAKQQRWDFHALMDRLGRRFYPTRDHADNAFGAAPSLPQSELTVTCAPLNPFPTPTPKP